MPTIRLIDHHTVYDNPAPSLRSRHAYFPGLVALPSGELLALFMLGEALEATDGTTVVSRSADGGRTWELQGPLHERPASGAGAHYSDYLKATLLADGRLIAAGYNFHRGGRDEPVTNAATDGVRGGDNLVSFSDDGGRTWTPPAVIPRTRPELIELSGPTIQVAGGAILGAGSMFPRWDGSNPSGCVGALLRSDDGGATWDDRTDFFVDPAGRYAPSEPRLCELPDGRIVALSWIMDHVGGTNLTNHVTISHDGGATWSAPIDTGVAAQASNLISWDGDLVLSVHSQREGSDIGVYARLADLAGDRWRTITESCLWENAPAMQIAAYATMGVNLKFGQPSLLRLSETEVLATHWAVEDGQGRILTHRLRVEA